MSVQIERARKDRDHAGPRGDGGRDDYSDVVVALTELQSEADPESHRRRRDEVIERCLPLAEHIARRFSGRGEPFEDLLQVARIGVIKAVDRFDPERGDAFLSFAVPTVMGEVRRHFRDTTWAVRVPRRIKDMAAAIDRATDELVGTLGRSPRPSEIAAHLGVEVSDIVDGLAARSAYNALSIDSGPGDDDTGTRLSENIGAVDERLEQIDECVGLAPVIEHLPQRELRILRLRFFESRSQTEIAGELGISQMHVSRLLSRTLAQIRAELGVPAAA